jgi:hypothetical protein
MRLLWTNHALDRPAGTEMATCDLVRALHARGHEIEIFTTHPGGLAGDLRTEGIKVAASLDECGGGYDLIHGQHLIETWLAMERWPDTPALFYCHGDPMVEWMETPPRHPALRGRVVTTCANLAGYLHRRGFVDDPVAAILPNAWNEARFRVLRQAPEKLRNAVFFHNTLNTSTPEWQLASEICSRLGISLVGRGAGFGKRMAQPEVDLPEYDLVFSSGRCALEAIVCGCAVVILALQRCGGLVGEADFEALQASNFTRGKIAIPLDADALAGCVAAYDQASSARLSQFVRETHALNQVTHRLEEIHRQMSQPITNRAPVMETPVGLLWDQHLRLRQEARQSRTDLARLRRDLAKTEQTSAQLRQSLSRMEAFLKKRWWLKPWVSKLSKELRKDLGP